MKTVNFNYLIEKVKKGLDPENRFDKPLKVKIVVALNQIGNLSISAYDEYNVRIEKTFTPIDSLIEANSMIECLEKEIHKNKNSAVVIIGVEKP